MYLKILFSLQNGTETLVPFLNFVLRDGGNVGV